MNSQVPIDTAILIQFLQRAGPRGNGTQPTKELRQSGEGRSQEHGGQAAGGAMRGTRGGPCYQYRCVMGAAGSRGQKVHAGGEGR